MENPNEKDETKEVSAEDELDQALAELEHAYLLSML